MPFDAMPAIGDVEAIGIVDRMMELLAEPEGWCRERLRDINKKGQHSYCLLGALGMAAEENAYAVQDIPINDVRPMARVFDALNAPYPLGAATFNDARSTTHADILMFLDAVRESFTRPKGEETI